MYSSVYIGVLFTTNETCVHVRCIVSWIECKYRVVNYCECYTSKFKSAGWFVNAIMPCLKDASYIMHIDSLICGPMTIL